MLDNNNIEHNNHEGGAEFSQKEVSHLRQK